MPKQKEPQRIKKGKIKNQIQLSGKLFRLAAKTVFSSHFIGISILVAIAVWTVWLTLTGPSRALSNLIANWEAAVTMIFGSIVAGGGTSMGVFLSSCLPSSHQFITGCTKAKFTSLAILSVRGPDIFDQH